MKVIAVIALLALPATAGAQIAEPQTKHPRHSFNGRHAGCNTHKCDRRMDKKAHAKTLGRWWRATQPYRAWLRSTRMCESGGNYQINTGNGFYGAYQFDASSWWGAGGHGYAHQAEPMEQDYRATIWLKLAGRGAWPVCG
jgi:Transglycosylase-like domain